MTRNRSASRSKHECASGRRAFVATLAALVVAPGCVAFDVFRRSDPAADERASREASSEALRELERRAKLSGDKRLKACFIGVSGGPNAGALSTSTRERLEGSKAFDMIGKREIQDALKESGVKANNIFIPREREKFVEALGSPIDFILVGNIETTESEDEEGRARRRRVYRLELVDVETNAKNEFVADL